MATLDWSQCPAVESVPGKVSGAWVFRDTRLPVATVIENLEDLSVEEVMEQFDVTREQIAAVLDFAAQKPQNAASCTGTRACRCSFSLTTERLGALPVRFQTTPSLRLKKEVGTGLPMARCCRRQRKPALTSCSPQTRGFATSRTLKGVSFRHCPAPSPYAKNRTPWTTRRSPYASTPTSLK